MLNKGAKTERAIKWADSIKLVWVGLCKYWTENILYFKGHTLFPTYKRCLCLSQSSPQISVLR